MVDGVKFECIEVDSAAKDARVSWHMLSAVQSALADLVAS